MSLDYWSHLRRETDAFAAAAHGNFESRAPSCPEWTVRDLVAHVWEVLNFWRRVAEQEAASWRDVPEGTPPPDAELLEAVGDESRRLIEVVSSKDPRTPIWTWSRIKDLTFLPRRMAHEMAIHRVDAELASGAHRPVDPDLASDGVEEFVDVILPARRTPVTGSGEKIVLEAIDGAGRWILEVGQGVSVQRNSDLDGHVTVTAPVSDLDLLLWRRVKPADVTVSGDRQLLDRFLDQVAVE